MTSHSKDVIWHLLIFGSLTAFSAFERPLWFTCFVPVVALLYFPLKEES